MTMFIDQRLTSPSWIARKKSNTSNIMVSSLLVVRKLSRWSIDMVGAGLDEPLKHDANVKELDIPIVSSKHKDGLRDHLICLVSP